MVLLVLIALLVMIARQALASSVTVEEPLASGACSWWQGRNLINRSLTWSGGDTLWVEFIEELRSASASTEVTCGFRTRISGTLEALDTRTQITSGTFWAYKFRVGDPRVGLRFKATLGEPVEELQRQLAWGWCTWNGANNNVALDWSDSPSPRLAMWNVYSRILEANQAQPVHCLVITSANALSSELHALGQTLTLGASKTFVYEFIQRDPSFGLELLVLDGNYPATATSVPPTGTPGPTATFTRVPPATAGPMVPRAYLPLIYGAVVPPTPQFTLTPTRTNTPTRTPTPIPPTSTPAPPADPAIPAWNAQQWAYGACRWGNQWHPVSWYVWDRLLYMSSSYIESATPGGVTQEDVWCIVVAEKGGVLNAGSVIQLGPNQRYHFRYWAGTPRGQFGFNFIANPR